MVELPPSGGGEGASGGADTRDLRKRYGSHINPFYLCTYPCRNVRTSKKPYKPTGPRPATRERLRALREKYMLGEYASKARKRPLAPAREARRAANVRSYRARNQNASPVNLGSFF